MSLQDLAAIGAFLQGLAGILLVLGGIFAWHKYKAAKRVESIKWITEIGSRFYQFDAIGETHRRAFEFDFFDTYAPAMEKWLVYPERLSQDDKAKLAEVDALLNFFELICHVSSKDLYLHGPDREAAFQYWFDDVIARSDQHVLLKLYLRFGFEHLGERIKLPPATNLIAVYGTLMQKIAPQIRDPELREQAKRARQRLGRHLGGCRIRGRLMDLGEYPGLVLASDSVVQAELYELPFGTLGSQELRDFRSALKALDEFEGIDVDDAVGSEYARRYVQLDYPANTAAWVYVLNKAPRHAEPIDSGDWSAIYPRKLAAAEQAAPGARLAP